MEAEPHIGAVGIRTAGLRPTVRRPDVHPYGRRRHTMPKTSKANAAEHMSMEGYEGHFTELDTGYTVGFETYTADTDLAEYFKGLPDDRCQCSHWGYVFSGKVMFKTADGDETFEAGDAYHVGPGHTPVLFKGTEVVEFSPTKELQQTIDVVTKNMEAAGG
jgi:hypothetical protein